MMDEEKMFSGLREAVEAEKIRGFFCYVINGTPKRVDVTVFIHGELADLAEGLVELFKGRPEILAYFSAAVNAAESMKGE